MRDESALAKDIISTALETADTNPSMSAESLSNALLTALVYQLLKSRSKRNILDFVEYDLDHAGSEFEVVTREC